MQQGITRRDAYEPTLSAVIGGRTVELESASLDRELLDPLGRSLTSASGELVALEGDDVTETVATPWDPGTEWPPVAETPVTVDMDTGSGMVALLRGGRVTSAGGGSDDREVEIGVADAYETLNRTISWDELADAMPSTSEGVIARYVGLQSVALTDRILRHCGWNATPPRQSFSVLSVPAQGTMWPEAGTVTTSQGSGGGYPGWLASPWGVGVSDTDTSYILAGPGYTLASRGHLELSAMTAHRAGDPSSRMDVITSTGTVVARLSWNDTTATLWLQGSAGAIVGMAQIPRVHGLLYATVSYVTATSVAVTLRCGGQTVTGTYTVHSNLTAASLTGSRIIAASICGGFQIAMPSTAHSLAAWTPNAVLYPRTSNRNTLRAIQPLEGGDCASLLAEQCEAEAATFWIDELGILRWWDLARLEAQAPVATFTSDDDIADAGFRWSHDRSRVKSRVAVKWREPMREWSWRTSVDLWQGSGQTIQPNEATVADPAMEWINVPDDEIWIMPDLVLDRVGTTTGDDFNYGWGSWYGGIIDDSDSWAQDNGSLLVTVERVTGNAFKVSTIWTGADRAVQKTPSPAATSALWRRRRDFDLPIIRGKARFKLADRLTYSAQSGPPTAPEHVIDAGWWIQRPEQAQYTADYYGARATVPQPVLSSIDIIPVPGLQQGDVVDVVDTHRTRLTIRGVVAADSKYIKSGMPLSHQITIRPTYVTRNGVVWQAWGAVMRSAAFQTFGAEQAGADWQTWGAAPLLGKDTIGG